jgi:hypothetical protein
MNDGTNRIHRCVCTASAATTAAIAADAELGDERDARVKHLIDSVEAIVNFAELAAAELVELHRRIDQLARR